jgi:hypothetical protein
MRRDGMGRLPLVIAVMAAGAVASCGTRETPVGRLLDDPAAYDGKTVRITGEVTQNISMMGYGAYWVDDGTGTITIVAKEGGAPRQGSRVTVSGEFRSGFTFGTSSMAVIEEARRKTL